MRANLGDEIVAIIDGIGIVGIVVACINNFAYVSVGSPMYINTKRLRRFASVKPYAIHFSEIDMKLFLAEEAAQHYLCFVYQTEIVEIIPRAE